MHCSAGRHYSAAGRLETATPGDRDRLPAAFSPLASSHRGSLMRAASTLLAATSTGPHLLVKRPTTSASQLPQGGGRGPSAELLSLVPDMAECEQCFQYLPLRNMRQHAVDTCPERMVQCVRLGCNERVRAKDLRAHQATACRATSRAERMAEQAEQRHQLAPCRLGCGADVAPARAATHEAHECLNRTVPCPHPECHATVIAKHLHIHLQLKCEVEVRRRELAEQFRAKEAERGRCTVCEQQLPAAVSLELHRLSHCPRRMLPCPEPGCGKQMAAADVEAHLRHECEVARRRREMAASHLQRLLAQVRCPRCGEQVAYLQQDEHRRAHCPARRVPCVNAEAGCPARVPLRDLATHVRERCPVALNRDDLATRARLNHKHLRCPWGCGVMLRGNEMQQHRDRECARRLSRCRHSGCSEMVPHFQLLEHEEMYCAIGRHREELAERGRRRLRARERQQRREAAVAKAAAEGLSPPPASEHSAEETEAEAGSEAEDALA